MFNEAFINKINKLKENIPTGEDPMINYVKNVKSCEQKFLFKTISLKDVKNILKSFKSTKTTGIDNISMKVIKDNQYILVPILTHIINLIILKNGYPDNMKVMKVIAALKKDKNVNDPESYRDINMANVIAKIIDKILLHQIMNYLEKK